MNKREHRTILDAPQLLEGDSPKITGYASVFNSPSNNMGFIEKVDPHAFDATLADNADVRALFNHNADAVLGRTKSGTLRLSVDAKGLKYEIDPPDTQVARDLITSMRRGDIDSSSFGFVTEADKWDHSTNPATRTLLKVSLFDISPVVYPAYEAASSEARNFPNGMPDSIVEALAHKPEETRDDTSDSVDAANEGADVADVEDDNACGCDCAQCEAGSCSICSDVDCDDANCACQEIRAIQLAIEVAQEFYKS